MRLRHAHGADQQQDGAGDVPGDVVGEQVVNAVADLVELEQLVVDDAVEELERAQSEEEPGPGGHRGEGLAAATVGEGEEPGDDDDDLGGVQQAVRQQANLGAEWS